jgi:8-oxo-dGTP pyrophosphatase MutT (NUDIX family)
MYVFIKIGESFEECAIREAKEETNLDLENMKLFHVTNNRNMDNDPLKHYITIFMKVTVCMYVCIRIYVYIYAYKYMNMNMCIIT